MKHLSNSFLFLALGSVALGSAACSSSGLRQLPATGIRTVSIRQEVSKPKDYVYIDETTKRTRGAVVGVGGLIPALIGEAIAGGSMRAGRARFDAAARQAGASVARVAGESFARELQASGTFQVRPAAATAGAAPADAEFQLAITAYGAAPAGPGRLAATMELQARLVKRDGTVVWEEEESDESADAHTLDDYQRDPRLFVKCMEQAARSTARKLVLEH